MRYENTVVIEGLDGSGKSTTALESAKILSDQFPKLRISVTDSTGLYKFKNGKLRSRRFSTIGDSKPRQDQNRLQRAAQAFKFARLRRHVNRVGEKADLLISVRDPDRLDPALYASVYASALMDHVGMKTRLQFFDRLTHAPHASAIILLQTSAVAATQHITGRDREQEQELDPHETPVLLEKLREELPEAVHTYERLFGAAALEVDGLRESTIEEVTSLLVPMAYTAQKNGL